MRFVTIKGIRGIGSLRQILTVLVVLAMVSAACGGDDSSASPTTEAPPQTTAAPPSEPEETETTEAAPAEPQTVRYFSMWNEGEPQQVVLQGIIDDFESETGIEVDVLWGGREILTSVRAALSAGDPVDLVDLDAEPLVGALVNTGETVSLAGVLDMQIPGENNTVGDVIPAAFLDVYAIDGEPHLIPYEVISSGIHYDGSRLASLGIDPPETWDEFIAASVAAGENAVQADGLINFYNAYWLYWLMVRHGGPGVFYEAASDPTGEAWRSEAIVNAVNDLVKLVESGAMAEGYDGSNYPLAQQEWAVGNGTFMVNGTWLASETSSYAAEGFDYRLLSFPTVPGGFDSAELYQIGWVVPRAAQTPDAAMDFIAYSLNRERLAGIADVAKNITPRSDIGVPPEIQDAADIFASEPPVHRIYDGVQGDFPEYWETVFLPLDDQLFFGQIGAQEFIDKITSATADYWASR
ncbi:MAG: ABC transporter substrate-binding protein [bacterium]|nr:ABC transporter substrate-binding protein [Acidimicrobiia bacterium]MCY4649675.1 ABC transporter substrate-binding protein [bacterium]